MNSSIEGPAIYGGVMSIIRHAFSNEGLSEHFHAAKIMQSGLALGSPPFSLDPHPLAQKTLERVSENDQDIHGDYQQGFTSVTGTS